MLCYYWYDTTTTAETTVQLLQYCKLQYDCWRGLSSQSSAVVVLYSSMGRREACGDWWRIFPVDGGTRRRTADSSPANGACATRSARPPTLPPSDYCLPLVRPTFVEGLPPDVSEYAHTGSRCHSVFDLNTVATNYYYYWYLLFTTYNINITYIYVHLCILYRQTLQWRIWISTYG